MDSLVSGFILGQNNSDDCLSGGWKDPDEAGNIKIQNSDSESARDFMDFFADAYIEWVGSAGG